MEYQMQINITRQDFVEFNFFHSVRSEAGRKTVRNARILLCAFLALMILFIWQNIDNTVISLVTIGLISVFLLGRVVRFEHAMKRNMAKQMDKMEKSGKLPFSPESTLIFSEEEVTETDAQSRTELNYNALERICIDSDRYIYLYFDSMRAIVLPISQVREQVDYPAFLLFLEQKCGKIQRY